MKDYEQIESSQRQHFAELEHNEKMIANSLLTDFAIFSMLKPKIFQDGNEWCILYGNNLQEGIAGFGKTIHKAIINFNEQFQEEIKE